MNRSATVLALGYAGSDRTEREVADLLAAVDELESPFAAYAWYAAGEVVLRTDPALAMVRLDYVDRLVRSAQDDPERLSEPLEPQVQDILDRYETLCATAYQIRSRLGLAGRWSRPPSHGAMV